MDLDNSESSETELEALAAAALLSSYGGSCLKGDATAAATTTTRLPVRCDTASMSSSSSDEWSADRNDDDDKTIDDEALQMYHDLGRPTRATLECVVHEQTKGTDFTYVLCRKDIDLLPWNDDHSRVDEANSSNKHSEQALHWYHTLARPTHATMHMCLKNLKGIDISPEQINELPWNADKTAVLEVDDGIQKRRENALQWYHALAQPRREVLYKLCTLATRRIVQKDDVNLLDWNADGTKVILENGDNDDSSTKGPPAATSASSPRSVVVNQPKPPRKPSCKSANSNGKSDVSNNAKQQSTKKPTKKEKWNTKKFTKKSRSTGKAKQQSQSLKLSRAEQAKREEEEEVRQEAEERARQVQTHKPRRVRLKSDASKAREFEDNDTERRERDRARRMVELRRSISVGPSGFVDAGDDDDEEEEEEKKTTKRELSPTEKKEKEHLEHLMKVYAWWGRLGQPNKKNFKRRIGEVKKSGVTPKNVDELPWSFDGGTVMVNRMNKIINAGYKK